jgi:diadenosine tetraphosphate (Ap4A) HIT family hydrolase
MEGCLACDLRAGRVPLPGGGIHETGHWAVEHCIGPLGLGTLVVKPKRHVIHVADLAAEEAEELGPLLRRAARAVTAATAPDQVYVTLWSHSGGEPGHIHWVVQPVTRAQMDGYGLHGPKLQVAMLEGRALPATDEVERVAGQLRALFDQAR